MVIDESIDEHALQRIEQWQRMVEDRAAHARELTERTSTLTATAREGDGIVEVTIGSGGQITSLRLDEEIRRNPTGQALIKSLDVRLGLGDHSEGDE
jgi:DNA-binding protein YbaB